MGRRRGEDGGYQLHGLGYTSTSWSANDEQEKGLGEICERTERSARGVAILLSASPMLSIYYYCAIFRRRLTTFATTKRHR